MLHLCCFPSLLIFHCYIFFVNIRVQRKRALLLLEFWLFFYAKKSVSTTVQHHVILSDNWDKYLVEVEWTCRPLNWLAFADVFYIYLLIFSFFRVKNPPQKFREILCRMCWLRLSRLASMYTVPSGLVGRGLRLRVPDVSPASVAGIFRGGCLSCRFWSDKGWLFHAYLKCLGL